MKRSLFRLRHWQNSRFHICCRAHLALGIARTRHLQRDLRGPSSGPCLPEGDRLAIVTETDANSQITVHFPIMVDWKRDNTVFEQIAISRRESFNLSDSRDARPNKSAARL